MPFFGVPIRNGLPIGLGSVAGFGVQQFDPSQLFEGGTVAGAWYDPSDLSTMFTTDAGTTPVAMPGQGAGVAVGLILDKSGNGNHARSFGAGLSSTRPELRARVNLLVATATLSTQSVTTQATSYTLSFAGTGSITLSGTATGSYSAGTHTITCTAGTLTLTVSGTVTTADLRPANSGALLPAYQAVVDANTYDTNGFPLYLRFDGNDDGMLNPNNGLNLRTNSLTSFAGVLINGANGSVYAKSLSATATGRYSLLRETNILYSFYQNNAGNPNATVGDSTNAPRAVTVSLNRTAGSNTLRANGTQLAQTLFTPESTDFNTVYRFLLGAYNNVDDSGQVLYLNGNIYGLILVIGSPVSAGNISATEQWVAGKTGIQI